MRKSNQFLVFTDALRTMQAEASKKCLALTSSLDQDIPQLLMGDRTRIRQILLNLVSNGIKFTEKGSIHIAAEVHDEVDEDNLFVQFKVIGILKKIF
jgi:signal transduction histidine kinase